MTHQSPKTHRDPPEPRLLDDGFLVEPEPPERVPWQGWERPVVTHPRRDFLLAAIAIALFAAIVALLVSGAWGRADATPRGAVQPRVTLAAVRPLTAERHLGAPRTWVGGFGVALRDQAFPRPAVPSGASSQAKRQATGVRDATASTLAPSGAVGTVLLGGTLSYVDPKYGPTYLALPFPRGTVAEICAVRCVTRRSTDYGPDQRVHPDRIADLSAADFVYVCGLPLSAGLCRGTVEIEPPVDPADERMRLEDRPLPATSTEETP